MPIFRTCIVWSGSIRVLDLNLDWAARHLQPSRSSPQLQASTPHSAPHSARILPAIGVLKPAVWGPRFCLLLIANSLFSFTCSHAIHEWRTFDHERGEDTSGHVPIPNPSFSFLSNVYRMSDLSKAEMSFAHVLIA